MRDDNAGQAGPPAEAEARRNKRRSRVFKLLSIVLSILVALLLAEGAVRILGLAPAIRAIEVSGERPRYQWSDNPILAYVPRPNLTEDPKTNSHGLADFERPVKKPAGVRRIILLGDSVLEGAAGGKESLPVEKLIPGQLEKLYADGKTEVLNLGVSGYCTLAEVELLRVKGLQFEPDVVVIVFVGNDFTGFNMDLVRPRRAAAVNWLFRHVHLFRLVCLKFDLFGFATGENPLQRNLDALGSNNVVKALSLFKELSIKHGFEPWIAVWPAFLDDRVTDVRYLGDGTDKLIVEALAEMNGIRCRRLSDNFRSHIQSLGGRVNLRRDFTFEGDGMHPNAEGARIGALALKSILDAPQVGGTTRPSGADRKAAVRAAKALGLQSRSPAARMVMLASEAEQTGDLPVAIRYYQAAVESQPDMVEAHVVLGLLFLRTGRPEEAFGHLRRALELRPRDISVLSSLGTIFLADAEFVRAVERYPEARRLKQDCAEACEGLAWLLATEAGVSESGASQAVELAQRARLLSAQGRPQSLDTLAAAYAAAGRFTEAIQTAQKATELALASGQGRLAEQIRARLELYQAGKPYRAKAPASAPSE